MEWGAGFGLLTVLAQLIAINIVLSGDNAVVIAMACRSLPKRQQRGALWLGGFGAVAARIVLTVFAVYLLELPYLNLAGGVVLLWIGTKLLLPSEESGNVQESKNLLEAIKTIVVADIVMSLDNVLAMAGAAQGHIGMLIVGLLISIPLILFSSVIIMRLMQRLPFLVTLGGALLGYVAGEMAVGDPSVAPWIAARAPFLTIVAPIAGAALVVAAGKLWARRVERRAHAHGAHDPVITE